MGGRAHPRTVPKKPLTGSFRGSHVQRRRSPHGIRRARKVQVERPGTAPSSRVGNRPERLPGARPSAYGGPWPRMCAHTERHISGVDLRYILGRLAVDLGQAGGDLGTTWGPVQGPRSTCGPKLSCSNAYGNGPPPLRTHGRRPAAESRGLRHASQRSHGCQGSRQHAQLANQRTVFPLMITGGCLQHNRRPQRWGLCRGGLNGAQPAEGSAGDAGSTSSGPAGPRSTKRLV